MIDKLANIVFDSAAIDHRGDGCLKAIISGEPVAINRKHKEVVTRRLTAKIILVTNTLPTFGDTSTGLWRRMQLLEFRRVVPEFQRDPGLKERLRTELPGIAHWAVQGLARLLRQGRFSRYERGEALLAEYRRECNPVAMFFEERCEIEAGARTPRQDAYDQFIVWSANNGFRHISSTEFYRKIDELCRQPESAPRDGRGGRRMLVGFRIGPENDIASQIRGLAASGGSGE